MTFIQGFFARLFNLLRTPLGQPRGFSAWTIPGIRFAEDGLRADTATATSMTWTGEDAMQVELTITTSARNRADSDDVDQLRDEQRRLASANGRALVLTDITATDRGSPLLEVVTKGRRGLGHDYVGITVGNVGGNTFTVRITAHEAGVTGLREAVVSAQLWELGELQLANTASSGANQAVPGWFVDPYNSSWDVDALHSVADDERLDVVFPAHPLSRVRAMLAQVRRSIVFDSVVAQPSVLHAGTPTTQDTRRGVPRVPSDVAVRELQWRHNCFDPIAAGLEETLSSINGSDAHHNEHVAEHLLLLGLTRARQEKHAEALNLLSEALDLYRALPAPDEVQAAVTMGHMARVHLELGNLDAAEALFPPALDVLERLRAGHLVLGMTLSGYGRLLMALDRPEARAYVLRAREIADTLGAGTRLFGLQETAGAPAPATTAETVVIRPL